MSAFKYSQLAVLLALLAGPAAAWDSSRLDVPLMVNGQTVPYPVFAIFVMPGSTIEVGFLDATAGAKLSLDGRPVDGAGVPLTAPATPGLAVLEIENLATGETARIHVFVMVPADRVGKDERLNGYRIGRYPATPLRGLDIYLPPLGFVEVTEANRDVAVSPNFTLGEFLAKQESGWPKYLVLRSSLLLKLENIIATLNRSGRPTGGFVIMSGYRTPFYNRAIGNVQYSRHVWGGAADFYIDEAPADGIMDDLNGDGRVNRDDARWLAKFIDDMSRRGEFGPRIGGIGVYGSTSAHGPFVHVDVRGTRARW
ncbi:MAG: D-Ala-D-Ala carboxypeptidase family metallohydrolase [Woeseiaceae bacterium]|nr:D-Ala-D-Ala carboxypeptidase family metallohydrolase [Woeseiaceae bacterium]